MMFEMCETVRDVLDHELRRNEALLGSAVTSAHDAKEDADRALHRAESEAKRVRFIQTIIADLSAALKHG